MNLPTLIASLCSAPAYFTEFLVVVDLLETCTNGIMGIGLPESFLSLDDSGMLSSKQRQRKCFTEYYSKYYCKARNRQVLRRDDHAVMGTDADFVIEGDAVFVSFHSFVL